MKITSSHLLIVFLTLIVSLPTMAQGAPPATPIDGGLTVLLTSISIYVVKRLKSKH